ncbi:hypothetical protein BWI93_00280 [Siphonobacter sp. BAB-5385]|uniref:HAD family hydrolase n=1 Tax=Siphonobacter sp. BAB-5385 TaxID=1864822 RepID=UPI000B9E9F79|nr:HAD family hydrolase [Siphonobacter sp. BAB-5385]OZI10118.1 hypothetical protein BWI93_00280 [Siphonobacter sp. BAB-5385]
MKPYSLILFDYDGTLCDSRQAILATFPPTFAHYGVPVPPLAELEAVVSKGLVMGEAFQVLNPALSIDEVNEWVTTYRAIYDQDAYRLVECYPGAKDLMEHLVEQGKHVVVISNKGIRSIETSLDYLGLTPYVSLILGDGSPLLRGMPKKPSPESYTKVIQPHFDLHSGNSTLMIGDTSMDLQYANNCAIDSCWATYGFGDPEACRQLLPTYEISSLLQLKEVIP